MGAGPMVLPRGVGGEKPPTPNHRKRSNTENKKGGEKDLAILYD